MCTGLQITAKNGDIFWGRTMDINISMFAEDNGFDADVAIVNVPKNVTVPSQLKNWTSKYATMGIGSQDASVVYDGINECGLAGDLQVLKECTWDTLENIQARGLQPMLGEEFVSYILTNFKTVDEIRQNYKKYALVNQAYKLSGSTFHFPLHYSFLDQSGDSIVLEPTENGSFKSFDYVGVMTNSPMYDYHTVNIRNYIGLNNVGIQKAPAGRDTKNLVPIEGGTGYGIYGLPGDYTSPSRFVRGFYLKNFLDPFDSNDGINQLYSVFRSVMIPRGLEHGSKNDLMSDFTRYWSSYDITKRILYVQSCRGLSFTTKTLDTSLTQISYNKINTDDHVHQA